MSVTAPSGPLLSPSSQEVVRARAGAADKHVSLGIRPKQCTIVGHYLLGAVADDGQRQPRQYAVSSTSSGTRVQVTVNRVRGSDGAPDGQVSTFVHDDVGNGDEPDVSVPAGDFVVHQDEGPLLLGRCGRRRIDDFTTYTSYEDRCPHASCALHAASARGAGRAHPV